MPPPLPPTPDQVIVRKDYDPKGGFRFSASCFSDLCLFPGWGLVIRHWEPLCRGPHSRAWDLVVCGALAQRTGPGKAWHCVGSARMKQHPLNPGCHPGSHSALCCLSASKPLPPAPAPDEYLVSPITGEKIPASKMQEHMRIGLLDPRWLEQRDRSIREKQSDDEVYAPGEVGCSPLGPHPSFDSALIHFGPLGSLKLIVNLL